MSVAQTTDIVTEAAILETREASPTHFLVKVESFSLLGKDGVHKCETGEFNAGGYKWRLIIYPNEDKIGEDKDYISVHLAISDTTSLPASWEVNAMFSIFLFNQIHCNYVYSLGRTRRFLAMKPEWGISKFVSKKVVTDPSNGYLVDNNCVFGAEVFIVEKSAVHECLSLDQKVQYRRDWKISGFSKLEDIWNSEQFVARGLNWKVSLNPKRKSSEKDHFLSTYLYLNDSSGKNVKTQFSICIKDQIKDKHKKNTEDCNWFSPTHSSWGWREFMERATLEDPNNGFIIDDCCILELELSVHAIV